MVNRVRYGYPLQPRVEKKYRLLTETRQFYVIGFSADSRPRVFDEHARFFLVPSGPGFGVRNLLMCTLKPLLVLWCVFRYNVRILVLSSPLEFPAALAQMVARCFGKRLALVVEAHGDFEEVLFLHHRVPLPRLGRWLMKRILQLTLRQAHVVRGISDPVSDRLRDYAPGKPLFQFPAWTDIDLFFEAPSAPATGTHCDIVYAGRLTPVKGLHHLMAAFSQVSTQFPEARLVLVGKSVASQYTEDLKASVNRLGLNGRVRFTGEVSQAALADYVQRSCALVLPSLSEGLGRVIFEAMACGTPAIASDVGGIPELIEDQVTGFLVPPGDEDALAERLRWVLSHPEEARQMGERARVAAREIFSSEAYVRNYVELFEAAEQVLSPR
jgi:glycosyltransferase involved in cell wall biosynthesis